MLLKLFRLDGVAAFGRVLVRDFLQRFPCALETREDKASKRKLENAERELYVRVLKFHKERRLSFFRKAVLLNTLRWELKDAGFSNVFIQKLTGNILMQLARSASSGG